MEIWARQAPGATVAAVPGPGSDISPIWFGSRFQNCGLIVGTFWVPVIKPVF